MRELKKNSVYIHFKHELSPNEDKKKFMYRILCTATHSETGETLIVYENVASKKCCARPYDMFMSKVDKEKYPNVAQEYRFEEVCDNTQFNKDDIDTSKGVVL